MVIRLVAAVFHDALLLFLFVGALLSSVIFGSSLTREVPMFPFDILEGGLAESLTRPPPNPDWGPPLLSVQDDRKVDDSGERKYPLLL